MPYVLTDFLSCYCLFVFMMMQLASLHKAILHPALVQQALGLLACHRLSQDIQTCQNPHHAAVS